MNNSNQFRSSFARLVRPHANPLSLALIFTAICGVVFVAFTAADESVIPDVDSRYLRAQAPTPERQDPQEVLHQALAQSRELKQLLKDRRFAEFKRRLANETFRPVVYSDLLPDLANIPVYSTNGTCKNGAVPYAGTEVEDLLWLLMKHYDVNDKDNGRWGINFPTQNFLVVLYRMSDDMPSCFSKPRLAALISGMLDRGLETQLFLQGRYDRGWWMGSIMRLGDQALVERILKTGVQVERKDWKWLYAAAPTLSMVKLLEKSGFRLTSGEYREILELHTKNPKEVLPPDTDPAVLDYYDTLSKGK